MQTWIMSNTPGGLGIALSFTSFSILMVLFQIPLDEVHAPAKHPAANAAVEQLRSFSEVRSFILEIKTQSDFSGALRPLSGRGHNRPV